MLTIAGLDYVRLEFNEKGDRLDPTAPVYPPGKTDIIVVSHGWHMDAPASQALYETLIGNLVAVDAGGWAGSGRTVGVCGVFWPSDQFRDDLGQETFNVLGGQAASAGGDLHLDVLKAQAASVAAFLGVSDPNFEKAVLRAVGGGGDADHLVDILRTAVGGAAGADAQTLADHKELLTKPGREILDALENQELPSLAAGAGPPAAAGAAAAFGGGQQAGQALGFFSGAVAGVAKVLNQFAYFELKKRAGVVGARLGQLLDTAPGLDAVRIHLVGHSFGARLVTAAAAAMTARAPQSLTLLQGAFSHNSYGAGIAYPNHAPVTGDYRAVITKVKGPIAITHTWNDTAVGLAYPAASRVSQTVASGFSVSDNFGGAKDIFGGMGSNGARGLTPAEGTDGAYDGVSPLALPAKQVSNLLCDFITEHNDVGRIEAARVVHAAMA
jgi:hypothetical protein